MSLLAQLAQSGPSTPLGPFEDSAVAWTTWATLMGFVGLTAFALIAAGPVGRRIGPDVVGATTIRLARLAAGFAVLAVPAVLTDLAHDLSATGGYDYSAAWNVVYDGTNDGRLVGLELTAAIVGLVLVAPLTIPAVAAGRTRTVLLGSGLGAGVIALGITKFPDEVPDDWGRTSFETVMWMLHLIGGAVWIGGLLALLALALPGAVAREHRRAFWPSAIRRFSVMAASCVAAIGLSGLWLYWEHVDGPTQLVTTMYGRVLGVKILIFASMLLLGAVNQFSLHPKIDALRAAGDDRPLHRVLATHFRTTVAVEVVLGFSVIMVAPFLHGSARNQAFQSTVPDPGNGAELPKLAPKEVTASTWIWGTTETIVVIAAMLVALWLSGRMARRRTELSGRPAVADPVLVR